MSKGVINEGPPGFSVGRVGSFIKKGRDAREKPMIGFLAFRRLGSVLT